VSVTPALIACSELPPEQEAIRAKCFHPTGTFVEFSRAEIEQSIPKRFAQIAANVLTELPKFANCTLTYNNLNKQSNRVAHAVLANANGRQIDDKLGVRLDLHVLFQESLAEIATQCRLKS
jgi:hypothetical protein